MLVKIACTQQDAFALTEIAGFIRYITFVAIVAQLVRAPACGAGSIMLLNSSFSDGLSKLTLPKIPMITIRSKRSFCPKIV